MSWIVPVVEALRRASSFERAVDTLLTELHRHLSGILRRRGSVDPTCMDARVYATSLFLDGRAGVVGARRLPEGLDPNPRPSHTAWAWVRDGRGGVVFDLVGGRSATIKDGRVDVHPAHARPELSDHSRQWLREEASHLVALPVEDDQGGVGGVLCVELAMFAMVDAIPEVVLEIEEVLQQVLTVAVGPIRRLPLAAAPHVDLPRWAGSAMRALLVRLSVLARLDVALLLTGAPGTGKTCLASWVHERSPRRGAPFVVVELGAVPSTLAAARIFGWAQGGFTGAERSEQGAIGQAAGGTLFLDDIHRAPLEAQTALLRLIESGAYERVGSTAPLQADVRFVFAAAVDLDQEVRQGRFLPDLLSRIRDLPVHVPNLDDRREEIPAWVEVFAQDAHRRARGTGRVQVTDEVRSRLAERSWPNNLRGLKAAVASAYGMALVTLAPADTEGPVIRAEHLPEVPATRGHPARDAVRAAAERFADMVDERYAVGAEPTDLELTGVFRGEVARRMLERHANAEAMRRLGRAASVRSGNAAALARDERERLRQALAALRWPE